MVKVRIKLDNPGGLAELSTAASAMPFDIDVSSDWYVADAKSLVGLFGLKLSKPIHVCIYTDRHSAQPFLDSIQGMLI